MITSGTGFGTDCASADQLSVHPMTLLRNWLPPSDEPRPLMALATCGPDGYPRVRHVLITEADDTAVYFHTDSRSAKVAELADNPRASIAIAWPAVGRQVVAAGPASGYGLWIRIQTDDGSLLEYGHNDQNYVSVGQRVHAGQARAVGLVQPEVDQAGRPTGQVLNVNADTAATAIAQALRAEKLVMLTNVAGIYGAWPDPHTLISEVSASDLRVMVPRLGEGMRPKAQALLDAIDGGVSSAAIVDGRIEHALLLEIFTTRGVGTMARSDDYV